MIWSQLREAVDAGSLRYLDLHFARHLSRLAGSEEPGLVLAAALTSQRVGQGDVCLDLRAHAGRPVFPGERPDILAPPFEVWLGALRQTPPVGGPGEGTPLILDPQGRCYLNRYWHFEQGLAEGLLRRAARPPAPLDLPMLRADLDRLFPRTEQPSFAGPDWQKLAAALALTLGFAVISGGPGTGKTRTVTAILALLLEQARGHRLRMALAAPTGKAAARLVESVRKARGELDLPPGIAAALPDQAFTLHRLLRFRPERAEPHFNAAHPLPLDLLVVDEASMVDLPLMARLVTALPPEARLILLGDKDQLASVEAGMVLGDICGRGRSLSFRAGLREQLVALTGESLPAETNGAPTLADHILILRHSYRFGGGSGIGQLAMAINAGDAEGALAILDEGRFPTLRRLDPDPRSLRDLIREQLVPLFRTTQQAADPLTAFRALGGLRVLCAVREGPFGITRLNQSIEAALVEEGAIPSGSGALDAGRPLMVLENDYDLGLFNGDLGLLWRDPRRGGPLRAYFETAEGVRPILPARLPRHETLYATTVHKSQGSEFDRVVLILPDVDSPLLTRELLYTAVTRAREAVTLIASRERIAQAVQRRVSRSSGLFERLWGTGPPSAGGKLP